MTRRIVLSEKSAARIDGIALVRSVFGKRMSEDEAGWILWNRTGWPGFYIGDDPVRYFRAQLRRLKRAYRLGRDVCACCGKIRHKSQMPDGDFCTFLKWEQ